MPEIISRKDAIARGLKRYFTGKPCKHGHLSERYVPGDCIACNRQRTKDSLRSPQGKIAWQNIQRKSQAKNREKILATRRRWRERNKEKLRIQWREEYRKKNRVAYHKAWRQAHRNEINHKARQRYDPQQGRQACKRYYWNGPSNPKGEIGCLRRDQALLRKFRRELRDRNRQDCEAPQ